jgi:hypothetical protein
MRPSLLYVFLVCVAGCSPPAAVLQRSQIAQEAQDKMIGLKKEQVLACMGIPADKATERFGPTIPVMAKSLAVTSAIPRPTDL